MALHTTPLHQSAPKGTPPSPVPTTARRSGLPVWGWCALGAASLAVVAAILQLIFQLPPRNTLVVSGVPQGADVYVDDVRSGIPTQDGKMLISYLGVGEHKVRCSQDQNDNKSLLIPTVQTTPCPSQNSVTAKLPPTIPYGGSEMVLIEGGPFPFGDDTLPDSKPESVRLVGTFYIDKFEVTNRQYKSFCDTPTSATRCPKSTLDATYFEREQNSPVIAIDHTEAVAYANSVNKRLPTEEEWEKAATWGPGWKIGHPKKGPSSQGANLGRPELANASPLPLLPIGSSSEDKSEYGVMDLAGNATEWVGSQFEPYDKNNSPANPLFNKGFWVIRGGDWISPYSTSLFTERTPEPRSNVRQGGQKSDWTITFRCAVSVSDPKLQEWLRTHENIHGITEQR